MGVGRGGWAVPWAIVKAAAYMRLKLPGAHK